LPIRKLDSGKSCSHRRQCFIATVSFVKRTMRNTEPDPESRQRVDNLSHQDF
jgi:hypothetical protein